MTPTQIARRSDALYADGTCGMTRRVLCDMVAQRESDLEDARAENDRLRELVKDFFDVPCQCLKCEHYNYEEDRCDLHDLARELGVEVDG